METKRLRILLHVVIAVLGFICFIHLGDEAPELSVSAFAVDKLMALMALCGCFIAGRHIGWS